MDVMSVYCSAYPMHTRPTFKELGSLYRYGVEEPYEKLKAFTRGQAVTQQSMQEFVSSINGLPEAAKADLAELTPATYIGNAAAQAQDIDRWLATLQ